MFVVVSLSNFIMQYHIHYPHLLSERHQFDLNIFYAIAIVCYQTASVVGKQHHHLIFLLARHKTSHTHLESSRGSQGRRPKDMGLQPHPSSHMACTWFEHGLHMAVGKTSDVVSGDSSGLRKLARTRLLGLA